MRPIPQIFKFNDPENKEKLYVQDRPAAKIISATPKLPYVR